MRPRMAAHYEEADLIRQAVLLAVGISQAQAFVDGNKRTAYAGMDVFLRLNGLMYAGDPVELGKWLEAIATREGTLEESTVAVAEWLRENVAEM